MKIADKISSLAVLLMVIGLLKPGCVPAQEDPRVVTMYVNEMKTVGVNMPSRVVIGNPEVADVMTVTENNITIAGKCSGMTNLIWWDSEGEQIVRLKVLAEDMSDTKARIDGLLKELKITTVSSRALDSEGKILLLGSVKKKDDIKRIETLLGPLYSKTTNLVVVDEENAIIQLDVEVLEVNKDATSRLGIKWPSSFGVTEPDRFQKRLADVPASLFRVTEWTHPALTATIDLLVQEGKARVLSRPRLACQSGKEAELLVGGEKPIMTTQTVSDGGTGTEVEYKEFGIKLKMAPELNSDGKVKLSLNVEVSDVGTVETLGSSANITARAYPLTKRTTSTQLVLTQGQTLAISGLIRQKTEEELQKVPILGNIPVLGVLFRHKEITKGGGTGEGGDQELVIMITPSIVVDKAPAASVAEEKKPEKTAASLPKTTAPDVEKKTKAPSAVAEKKPEAKSVISKEPKLPVVPEKLAVADVPAPAVKKEAPVESPEEQAKKAVSEYVQKVGDFILGSLEYPSTARKAKIEGTVILSLLISSDGRLLDVKVNKSSGYSVLDADALFTAKKISPYPVFPAKISDKEMLIKVPIVYNLS